MLLSIFGFAAGIGTPMQTSINAEVGRRAGSPFIASLINFIVALSAMLLVTIIWEHGLHVPFERMSAAPLWAYTGGMFATFFVTCNILLMPRVGSVQTVIFPTFGQILMGTLIDTFGLFHSAQKDLTFLRIVGIVLVFIGILIVIMFKSKGLSQKNASNIIPVRNVWIWRFLGLIAGMCMACQTAANSYLGFAIDSRPFAAVINLAVGFVILIFLNIILLKTKKPGIKNGPMPFWIWTGGLIGALYVVGNIITAQTVGTGMAVIILLTGQMIGSLLVDQFGLFRSPRRLVSWKEIADIIVMVAGAVLFHLF